MPSLLILDSFFALFFRAQTLSASAGRAQLSRFLNSRIFT